MHLCDAAPMRNETNTSARLVALLDGIGQVVAYNDAWCEAAHERGEAPEDLTAFLYALSAGWGSSASAEALITSVSEVIADRRPHVALTLPRRGSGPSAACTLCVDRMQGPFDGVTVLTATFDTFNAARDLAARSEFIQNISHELRTPLNAVIGFSNLLLREPLDEPQTQKIRYIHEAGRSLLELVNNLIDFSNIQAGNIELANRAFDVHALLRESIALISPMALEKGLDVEWYLDDSVPRILRGDRTRVRQVLLNLLSNAVKFTPSGRVGVEVHPVGQSESIVTLRLVVRDTGIGIAADRLQCIFEPFRQAEGSTIRPYNGAGIGLAVCQRLAQMMGGTIGVESQPGRGATFWLVADFGRESQESSSLLKPSRYRRPCS